jgi:hypothetical protein
VIGLRLFIAALLVACSFSALGVAWWESSQREPGRVRAIGSMPGDYQPLRIASTAPASVLSPDAIYAAETRCHQAGGVTYTKPGYVVCTISRGREWIFTASDVREEDRWSYGR